MKNKKKLIILVLLVMILSIPVNAFACFDDYGYNQKSRMFKGTLENWEALLSGSPATPWDRKALDVVFVERKWDKLFDPMLSGNPPLDSGAWQKASLWQYLSGDQLGWTWHLDLKIVYSPKSPIPGALVLSEEEMGITGFYCVTQKEWLTGPRGQKVIIQDFSVHPSIIQRALKSAK